MEGGRGSTGERQEPPAARVGQVARVAQGKLPVNKPARQIKQEWDEAA